MTSSLPMNMEFGHSCLCSTTLLVVALTSSEHGTLVLQRAPKWISWHRRRVWGTFPSVQHSVWHEKPHEAATRSVKSSSSCVTAPTRLKNRKRKEKMETKRPEKSWNMIQSIVDDFKESQMWRDVVNNCQKLNDAEIENTDSMEALICSTMIAYRFSFYSTLNFTGTVSHQTNSLESLENNKCINHHAE